MVNKLFKKNCIKNRLKKLIEDRIFIYYPDLASIDIHIRDNFPVKKCLTSIIYQFDIYNHREILKSLVVKKRIFIPTYNNDIAKETKEEFENLRFLNNLPERNFSIPFVLDVIPEEGVLITEKVEGKTFFYYLQKFSHLPLTKSNKFFLEKMFTKVGGWLKEFHQAGLTGQNNKIDTQEYLRQAQFIVDKFHTWGLSNDLGQMLVNKMTSIEKEVSRYTFPVTFKHDDFQPMNIIYDKEQIIVVDISYNAKDINIKDVCNFITGVKAFNIKSIYSLWNRRFLNGLIVDFLKAYFKNEPIPYAAIQFLNSKELLWSLEGAYKRNSSFMRRNKVLSFYKKKILESLSF